MDANKYKATKEQLEKINQLGYNKTPDDPVYVYRFKAADPTKPTDNNTFYSREFLQSITDQIVGTTILVEHNEEGMRIGRAFDYELNNDGLFVTAFTVKESVINDIESEDIHGFSLSINTQFQKESDGIIKAVPSPKTRIREFSAVAVPSCRTCTLIRESMASCECEIKQTESVLTKQQESMIAFAAEKMSDLKNEFVKTSAFALGTSIDRKTYQQVAESLDPKTLQTITTDLRRCYEKTQQTNVTPESVGSDNNIKQQLETIISQRGK